MDGLFLKKKAKYTGILKEWLDKGISSKLWERLSHLHLFQIDKTLLKKPDMWIDAGFFCFQCLNEIIDKNLYNPNLVIPLTYEETEADIPAIIDSGV